MIDWGDGKYETTGVQLEDAARRLVDHAEIARGERVLDIGCGTGNAAIAAARKGARVTAIDPAERLVEVTRQRAADSGLSIAYRVADAAEPGVDPASFDAAVASFSIIFAPEPEAAVQGALSTLRPGGRLVLSAWIPEGPIHDSSGVLVEALFGDAPPRPWSSDDGLRALFQDRGVDLDIQEATLPFQAPSGTAWFEDAEANHPFWRFARNQLDAQHYQDVRRRCIDILEAGSEKADCFHTTSRYRLVRAVVPA